MNTDHPATRDPHLDLGDLIAGAAGAAGRRARAHLAGCQHCQLEESRWNLVAEGVRGLADAVPQAAPPAPPRRPRQRVPAPWRRAMLAVGGAAAALVLLAAVGVAAGVVHVHLSGPGSGSPTALAAVTGCSQLRQADGTLLRVNERSLVISTAGGRPVTVTTTAATLVSMSGALLGDITDGASVLVHGHRSGGTFQAVIVTVGQPFSAVNPPGFTTLRGTVSGAGPAGFTLATPGGTRVAVTTSGSTVVVVPHARPAQLRAGATIFALGRPGSAGTLAARAVSAVTQFSSGPQLHARVSVRNCSPSSIAEALGAISTAQAAG